MCYMIKKKRAKRKTHKPAKKSRTKTRKLSLISLELSSVEIQQSTTNMPSSATATATATATSSTNHQQQLNLFPLHPENTDENNMAYLFSSATDGAAVSTLTGLLGTSTTMTSRSEEDVSAASLSYAAEIKEVALLRTALRNKERDSSEERYVRYSEVVERRDEEVTSSAVDLKCGNRNLTVKIEKKEMEKQRLSLKLDYEEILNAWSDKGSLYIYADSPQIVPDIHDNFLAPGLSNGLSDHHIWGSHAGLWTVPELSRSNPNIHEIKKEEEQQEQHAGVGLEEWKLGKRKASVLRYKEKRQNRLFSKQIRYQVRKQNAEKRPRVKGRFVKRS